MLVNSDWYKKSSKTQKIRCEICANYCKIAEGNVGICCQHKNINGELFDESYGQIWVNDCCDKWIKGFLQLAFTVDTKGVYTLDMMLDELLDDSMDVKNGISKEDVDFVVHKFNEKIRFTDKLIDEFLFSASQEHKREY